MKYNISTTSASFLLKLNGFVLQAGGISECAKLAYKSFKSRHGKLVLETRNCWRRTSILYGTVQYILKAPACASPPPKSFLTYKTTVATSVKNYTIYPRNCNHVFSKYLSSNYSYNLLRKRSCNTCNLISGPTLHKPGRDFSHKTTQNGNK